MSTAFKRSETLPPLNSRTSRYRKAKSPDECNGFEKNLVLFNKKYLFLKNSVGNAQPPKKTEVLLAHVTVTGQSQKSASHGVNYFNITQHRLPPTPTSNEIITPKESLILHDLMGSLIDDVLTSTNIIEDVKYLSDVEPPYFQQLEHKPLPGSVSRESTQPNLFKTILKEQEHVITEKAIPDMPALKMATELIESTMNNILSDAVHDIINVTQPHRFFVKKSEN